MQTRVKLFGGGGADVDHSQIIGGHSQIIRGDISPRVLAPLFLTSLLLELNDLCLLRQNLVFLSVCLMYDFSQAHDN